MFHLASDKVDLAHAEVLETVESGELRKKPAGIPHLWKGPLITAGIRIDSYDKDFQDFSSGPAKVKTMPGLPAATIIHFQLLDTVWLKHFQELCDTMGKQHLTLQLSAAELQGTLPWLGPLQQVGMIAIKFVEIDAKGYYYLQGLSHLRS